MVFAQIFFQEVLIVFIFLIDSYKTLNRKFSLFTIFVSETLFPKTTSKQIN